jgi:pimeloyl-ACP methyl ester carboxylesterase
MQVGETTVRTRDGRALHVEVRGTGAPGTPTVVLEAGMGASHHMWGAVMPLVAARTQVVAYDRSGLGQSPPDPAPRDVERLADDLLDVLATVDGPLVLVGHSWGGPIVRIAASRVPDRVAGLVLVDQTDEGCDLFLTDANRKRSATSVRLLPLMGRIGALRLVSARLAKRLPEPDASALRRHDGTAAAARAQAAELVGSLDDIARLAQEPPVLPDVPVTVVGGAKEGRLERGQRGALLEAYRARVAALPQGRLVLAERSSHLVPFTEPDLVATEILRLLDPS